VQMCVLRSLLEKYGHEFGSWLTSDHHNELLNILRDSFVNDNIADDEDKERQRRSDIMIAIELLAGAHTHVTSQ